jgi:hypothetical protein
MQEQLQARVSGVVWALRIHTALLASAASFPIAVLVQRHLTLETGMRVGMPSFYVDICATPFAFWIRGAPCTG